MSCRFLLLSFCSKVHPGRRLVPGEERNRGEHFPLTLVQPRQPSTNLKLSFFPHENPEARISAWAKDERVPPKEKKKIQY